MQDLPQLIAIVGATAVGKTRLALELAAELDAEIVSADSRQIYRGMNIGTAKPTANEQAAVPHHLIDIVDPGETFSLARFQDLATTAVDDILARGRQPLLVGGTGQYLAAILEGWQIPRVAPQPELRAALEQEAALHGSAALHRRLAGIDPAAAAAIAPENVRRIIRALEVFEVSGQPISAQQGRRPPPYHIKTRWLIRERSELYARIDQRVDAMMAAGLIAEVAGLIEQGYTWELPAMSSLGYIQFRPYLAGEADLADCVQQLKYDTHAFARRQESWFRRLPGLQHYPMAD